MITIKSSIGCSNRKSKTNTKYLKYGGTMDLYCGKCRFLNKCGEGLKCKIYNNQLSNRNMEVMRLEKCKLENSKFNKTPEKAVI